MSALRTKSSITGKLSWLILFLSSNFLSKAFVSLVFLISPSFLTSNQYASFSLSYSSYTLCILIISTGTIELLSSTLALDPQKQLSSYFAHPLSALFRNSLVTLLLSPLLFRSLPLGTSQVIFLLIPIALFTSVSSLNAFILRFNDKNASALAYSFLIPVVGYSSLFITLYLTHSTTYAFAAWLVSLFIAFILIFIRDPIYPNTSIYDIFRLSLDVKVAFPYYILNILGWFSGYGMNFIVDLRFTLDEVSQYTFLSSIAALSQLILASVQMLWSPSFLRMISSSPYEAAQKSHKIYSIVTLIIPLLASIAYLLAMHFSSISGFSILEKSYSTVYLLILFIAYLLCIPYWQAQDYLVANNASFMLLNITLISAAISFPLWIYLQSLIGIPGIFVGFAIQMFVKSFVAVIMTPKTWKVRPPYLPISLSVACLSIIVVFTALHNS